MATKTTNYEFILPVGSDNFNPLTDQNPNWSKADTVIKKAENQSVAVATEIKSGSVHAITIPEGAGNMFRFVATSKFGAQDTCTVNGVQVTALMPNGTTIPEGGWVINSNVLCCLTGKVLTVYTTIGGDSGSINADTLDGHSADYFATNTALNGVKETAEAASRIANAASSAATTASVAAASKSEIVALWTNRNPETNVGTLEATLATHAGTPKFYIFVQNATTTSQNGFENVFATLHDGSIYANDGYTAYRTFTVAGNKITFSGGYAYGSYGSNPVQRNNACIPVAIYGVY